jgi:hypothetical protein
VSSYWILIRRRYINALEERVAFLEARLPDHAEDHYENSHDARIRPTSTADEETPIATQHRRTFSQSDSVPEDPEFDDRQSLVDGVAYLSLCASGTTNTASEPYYLGSSSGATIARVIQSSIYRNPGDRTAPRPVVCEKSPYPEFLRPQAPASDLSDETVHEFPDWELARMLFDVFFERIHTRWPLLDRVVYTKVFDNQYVEGALTVVERSTLHLIYAITARFLSLTRKPCGVDYEVGPENASSKLVS